MNISLGGFVLPPAPTGHPAALPADPYTRPAPARVTALAGDAATPGAMVQEQGEMPSTPPSAMQRKIMEILQAQAEALEAQEAGRDPSEDRESR